MYGKDILADGAFIQCNATEGSSDPFLGYRKNCSHSTKSECPPNILLPPSGLRALPYFCMFSPIFLQSACSLTETSLLDINIHKMVR